MAVAATKTKAAPASRTITRDAPPPVAAAAAPERMPERDPNKIYTRDGRVVDIQRVMTTNDDRLNLARLGIHPPQGWTYEWRTVKVKGAEWTRQIVDDAQNGWTPVPAERHPGKILPMGAKGPIEQDGLMLMERDERLTAMSDEGRKRAANEQLNISRNMNGLMQRAAPNVEALFTPSDHEARRATGVNIERIPMGTPDKNYSYSLDE